MIGHIRGAVIVRPKYLMPKFVPPNPYVIGQLVFDIRFLYHKIMQLHIRNDTPVVRIPEYLDPVLFVVSAIPHIARHPE